MIFLKLQKLGKKVSQLALLVIAAVKMFIVALLAVIETPFELVEIFQSGTNHFERFFFERENRKTDWLHS